MATDAIRPKPPRRTQAERTATMRARILNAAIECLDRTGYGATTTVSVAATAQVSRGAMLHHFPSKADLMLAALTYAIELDDANFDAAAQRIDDPRERYAALPDLRLATVTLPAGIAYLEIMVGARSDETIIPRFAEFQELIEDRTPRRMAAWADAAGITVTPRDRAVSRTIVLAIFGLAVQRQVWPGIDAEEVMTVLRALKREAMEPVAPPARATH